MAVGTAARSTEEVDASIATQCRLGGILRAASGLFRSLMIASLAFGITQGAARAASTTTELTSTPNPSTYGSPVTFSAKITAFGAGEATGTVTFKDGASDIGTGTLVGRGAGQEIAAGPYHTCALTSPGGVACWGYNGNGQLGDNTTTNHPTPVDVTGLSGVTALAGGFYHTCALTSAGGVKCWGYNYYGQLGDNTNIDRHSPVDVAGLSSGVVAISANGFFSCALTSAGAVKCWGHNNFGQLGDGSTTDRTAPVDAVGLSSGVTSIAVSADHTCALTIAGGVKCWGRNDVGQLGDSSTTDHLSPVGVVGLANGIVAIAGGAFHSCAVTGSGGVKCWGSNYYAQLGDNTTTDRTSPVDVLGLSGVAAIAGGRYNTCALTSAGGAKCWGGNWYGELGDGTTNYGWSPVGVVGLSSGTMAITIGYIHTCALTSAGGVKCWGSNTDGELGDNTTTESHVPVDVVGLVAQVQSRATLTTSALAGGSHSITATYGGDASHATSQSPVLTQTVIPAATTTVLFTTPNPSHAVDTVTLSATVSSSGGTPAGTVTFWEGATNLGTVALSSGAASLPKVFALGSHTLTAAYSGDTSFAASTSTAVTQTVDPASTETALASTPNPSTYGSPVNLSSEVTAFGSGEATGMVTFKDGTTTVGTATLDAKGVGKTIHTGHSFGCAVTSAGGVACWGRNGLGQLGDNSTTDSLAPVDVVGLSGVVALAGGFQHTCALTRTGVVKCWGYNFYGQLGDNTKTDRHSPVDVSGLPTNVVTISAGDAHTCALTSTGGVKCWGSNDHGQVGDNSTTDRVTATDVVGLSSGIAAVAGGVGHTCAVTGTGGVKCWGANNSGQLGDNTTIERHTPTAVSGLSSGVVAATGGSGHTCVLTSAGGVKCWGGNGSGQLGDNSTTSRLTPVDIPGLSGTKAIDAGGDKTCALMDSGAVKCWGDNTSGQLGDNSTTNRLVPVDVVGLSSGGVAIMSADAHTCALTGAGGVKCWGYNVYGQLGDNSTTERHTPVDVRNVTAQIRSRATWTTSALSGGSRSLTATYDGDGPHATSQSPALIQTVTPITSTTTLTTSGTPSGFSEPVTFTATIATAAGTPNGTVTFRVDGSDFGTVALSGFTATLTTSALTVAAHTVTAVYGGDGGHLGSTSASLTQTVAKDATTTTVSSSASPASYGQTVTFTATVAPTASATGSPSGTVTFNVDGADVGTATLAGGSSSLSLSNLSVGSHPVVVTYAGDTGFDGSTSATSTQQVTRAVTTTALSTTPNPSRPDDTVTLSAAVSSSGGTPAGTVTFWEGATNLGTVALSSGSGSLPKGFALGSHTLTATYSGDTSFVASTSAAVTQIVEFAATETALASTPNPSTYGSPVNLSARVTAFGGGEATGTVTFKDGTTTIGAGPLDAKGVGQTISVGTYHTCVLASPGGVKCWGRNSGNLGDNSTTEHLTPVDMAGLSGAVAIAAGGAHDCVLTGTGGVKCWGTNTSGQLGDNSTIDSLVPVDVVGLSDVVAITAGEQHTCALTRAGGAKCWGSNYSGELGDNSTSDRPTPTEVSGLSSGVVALSADSHHTCALTGVGGVKCWGSNSFGQLGDNSTTDSLVPVDVVGLSDVMAITAGEVHTCALTRAGRAKCWGGNPYGQLGDNSTTDSLTPVDTAGLSGISAITGGAFHTCALTGTGGVKCWGSNSFGQLGDSSTTYRHTPADVSGLSSGVVAIGAGESHTCAQTAVGGVKCWGGNRWGRLGDGTATNSSIPVDVLDLTAQVQSRATLITSALSGGSRSLTASYDGDDIHTGSTSAALAQTVTPIATSTTLSSSKSPTVFGEAVTFTATVTSSSGTPSETVTFSDGGMTLGTGTLSGVVATFTTSGLSVGEHTITAAYGGDAAHAPSTSASLTQSVAKGATAATAGSSASSISLGQSVTVTASLAVTAPAAGTPSGTVTVSEGGATLGTATLSGGAASFVVTPPSIGAHAYRVAYDGDDNFTGSTASDVTVTVGKIATTTALSATPNPAQVSQAVTLTATVSGSDVPAGTVSFLLDGVTTLGTGTLVGGVATLSTSTIPVGVHTITASYGGSGTHAISTSAAYSQTVNQGATATTVTVSTAQILPGGSVTLDATVAVAAPATGTATGNAVFKDGSKILGSVALADGKARLVTTALTTGLHHVQAAYSGTTDFTASTSSSTDITVDPRVGPEFRVNTITAGSQQYSSVAALSTGGFVVAWASKDPDGSGWGIYTQRYKATGAKSGGEARADMKMAGASWPPAIVGTADGGFVVAWIALDATGKSLGIWGQRFGVAGAKAGSRFRIDTTAGTQQRAPALSARSTGGFLATWISTGTTGTDYDVYGQLHDGLGKRVGGEQKLSTVHMPNVSSSPAVATLARGGFVVVWPSVGTLGAKPAIKGQRLDPTGARSGGEFAVTAATFIQSDPVVAATEDGGFTVSWVSSNQDGSGKGIYAQRHKANGRKSGPLFRVNTTTIRDQSEASLAARPGGGFTVAWTSTGQDGSGKGVFAQRFSSTGVPIDVEFRLNTTVAHDQFQPSLGILTATDFVATWTSVGQDGSLEGVYGQRFSIAP